MKLVTAATLALTLALAANHAHAADKYQSWEGKWTLNKDKTKYPPQIPVTANDVEVTKDDGMTLQYSGTVVIGGKSMSASFDGAFDGKPHDAGGGQTLTYHHVSKSTFASVRKGADGKVAERSTCKFSPDGKAVTCHIELPQATGKALTFDEYFDKVS